MSETTRSKAGPKSQKTTKARAKPTPPPPRFDDETLPAWLGREYTDVLAVESRDGWIESVSFLPGLLSGGPRDGLAAGYDDDYPVTDGAVACGRVLRHLIDRPVAARLAHLRIDAALNAAGNDGCYGSHRDFLRELLARDRPALETLEVDPWCLPRRPEGQRAGEAPLEMSFLLGGFMHWAEIQVGDLSALWARAPGLTRLVLAQPKDARLGEIDAPSLHTLVYGGFDEAVVASIARGALPSLETLLVRVESQPAIRALLASSTLGRVRHLGLIGTGDTATSTAACDTVVDALLASTVLEQLETLDLGGFVASDAACTRLLQARSRFANLRALRLSSWAPRRGAADWWYGEDSPMPFRGSALSPHKRPAGVALAEALPVRWLTVSGHEHAEPPARHHLGVFLEGYRDQDNFAERRPR